MECLAELYVFYTTFSSYGIDKSWICSYISNRQPGKALPFVLRLRRPNVFDLIRENNLFTAVQDQALLLVEFDQELVERRRAQGEDVQGRSAAISLLVDHTHSIPVRTLPLNQCNFV